MPRGLLDHYPLRNNSPMQPPRIPTSNAPRVHAIAQLVSITRLLFFTDPAIPDYEFWLGGTAFALRCRRSIWMVTARHNLDKQKNETVKNLRILLSLRSREFATMSQTITGTTSDNPDTFIHDFLAMHVRHSTDLDMIPALSTHCFVNARDLSPGSRSTFYACGYPHEGSRINYGGKQLAVAPEAINVTYRGLDDHNLLEFTHFREKLSPTGMSGSPIFRVTSDSEQKTATVALAGMIVMAGTCVFRCVAASIICGIIERHSI